MVDALQLTAFFCIDCTHWCTLIWRVHHITFVMVFDHITSHLIWVFGGFFPSFIFIAPHSVVLEARCLFGVVFLCFLFFLVGWLGEWEQAPGQAFPMLWGLRGATKICIFPALSPLLPPDNQHHLLGCWSHLGYRKPSRGPTLLSSWTSFLFPSLKCGLLSVFTACEKDRLVSRMARFLCKTYL